MASSARAQCGSLVPARMQRAACTRAGAPHALPGCTPLPTGTCGATARVHGAPTPDEDRQRGHKRLLAVNLVRQMEGREPKALRRRHTGGMRGLGLLSWYSTLVHGLRWWVRWCMHACGAAGRRARTGANALESAGAVMSRFLSSHSVSWPSGHSSWAIPERADGSGGRERARAPQVQSFSLIELFSYYYRQPAAPTTPVPLLLAGQPSSSRGWRRLRTPPLPPSSSPSGPWATSPTACRLRCSAGARRRT